MLPAGVVNLTGQIYELRAQAGVLPQYPNQKSAKFTRIFFYFGIDLDKKDSASIIIDSDKKRQRTHYNRFRQKKTAHPL